jgi:hypothetical protein
MVWGTVSIMNFEKCFSNRSGINMNSRSRPFLVLFKLFLHVNIPIDVNVNVGIDNSIMTEIYVLCIQLRFHSFKSFHSD